MPIKVINKSQEEAEIQIDGVIWDNNWGDEVTPKEITEQLNKLKNEKTINVHINSDGGLITAGIAIYNKLKDHPAKVNVYIDGIAASIAGVIAMAGDRIYIAKNAGVMVHRASAGAYGDASQMRKIADDLEKFENTIIGTFVDRTGQTEEKIKEIMYAETFLFGEDAVSLGFADEIIPNKTVEAQNLGGKFFVNKLEVKNIDVNKFPKNFFKSEPEPEPEPVNYSMLENELSLITQSIEEATI